MPRKVGEAVPVVALGLGVIAPWEAHACEPAVALTMLFMGPAATVGLVYVGLVVAVKCLLFAIWQDSLPAWKAAGYMLAGNGVSSAIGLLIGVLVGVPPFWIVALPVIYGVSLPAARRAVANPSWPRLQRRSPAAIASLAVLGLFVTLFFYLTASFSMVEDPGAKYWLTKLVYVEIAVAISMALTVFWETGVVARLANMDDPRLPFLGAVIRANLAAYVLLFGGAAVMVLPARLRAPGLLVHILQELTRLA